jgi:signal transduction histidine kinase
VTDVQPTEVLSPARSLHTALDMNELACALGGMIESLAGPVPWRVRLGNLPGGSRESDLCGMGEAAGANLPINIGNLAQGSVFEMRFRDEAVGELVVGLPDLAGAPPWSDLADHVAAAVVKLQLWNQAEEESCQRRLAEEVLGDVSAVIGSFDLEYVLARSLEQVLRVVGSEVGSVMRWDGQRFSTSVVLGLPEEVTGAIQLEGKPVAELVARAGEPLILENPEIGKLPEALESVHLNILLAIPLVSGQRVVGVLQTVNPSFTDATSPAFAAAQGICRLAAVAVENALLHQETVQQERMATIGLVMAGLSHDIKNMLNSMKTGYYLLQMGVDGQDMECIAESFPIIGSSMQRISGFVMDMLDYSKSRKPQRSPMHLNALAEEIVGAMGPVAADKDVKLVHQLDADMDTIPADSNAIFRCLSNLVTNAVEAVEKGGEVTVRTEWSNDDAYAALIVEDNGSGIPDEDQEKIFDALFSSKGSKGTGLGLAVTKKIVEEHGGEIGLDSELGRGTTFSIRLPKEA